MDILVAARAEQDSAVEFRFHSLEAKRCVGRYANSEDNEIE
jgi:hypothetical protein